MTLLVSSRMTTLAWLQHLKEAIGRALVQACFREDLNSLGRRVRYSPRVGGRVTYFSTGTSHGISGAPGSGDCRWFAERAIGRLPDSHWQGDFAKARLAEAFEFRIARRC
jgi:hypothetical protein